MPTRDKVPDGWKLVKIGDVTSQIERWEDLLDDKIYRLFGVKWYAQGLFERESKAGKQIKAEKLNLIEEGDFVYNRLFAWKGSFGIVRKEHSGGYVSGEFPVFRGINGKLASDYLNWYFSRPYTWKKIEKESMGTSNASRLRWNEKSFKSYKVLLPPMPEQRKIAGILGSVDDVIERTRAVIEQLKTVKKALMDKLLTCGIDKNGKIRDPIKHPELFKQSRLGLIPKEWQEVRLTDYLSLPTGQVDPKQKPYKNMSLIAPDHIESGTGRIIGFKTAFEQNAISGKYLFHSRDVLYVKIRPYLRKACIADGEGLCSADIYPLHPNPKLDSNFLLALLLGERFSKFAISVSMRSGFPKINRNELSEYKTALPALSEQKFIASILESLNSNMLKEEAKYNQLEASKRGFMQALLTGKVRVRV